MRKLIQGIIEFRKKLRPEYRETFAKLALGQAPDALLVACSDSRVAPNLFASTEPGDLFVVRNPGNIIAPCGKEGMSQSDESEAAAIEYATAALQIKDVIVCGHSECGAMKALMDGRPHPEAPHLDAWLRHAEGAYRQVKEGARPAPELSITNQLSQLNVLQQLENLRTYPIMKNLIKTNRLHLHAWWFDIAQAEVYGYDPKQGRFVVIDEAEADRHVHGVGDL